MSYSKVATVILLLITCFLSSCGDEGTSQLEPQDCRCGTPVEGGGCNCNGQGVDPCTGAFTQCTGDGEGGCDCRGLDDMMSTDTMTMDTMTMDTMTMDTMTMDTMTMDTMTTTSNNEVALEFTNTASSGCTDKTIVEGRNINSDFVSPDLIVLTGDFLSTDKSDSTYREFELIIDMNKIGELNTTILLDTSYYDFLCNIFTFNYWCFSSTNPEGCRSFVEGAESSPFEDRPRIHIESYNHDELLLKGYIKASAPFLSPWRLDIDIK